MQNERKKLTYSEIWAQQWFDSQMAYYARKVTVGLAVVLQHFPLTPNFFTTGSTIFVMIGTASLVFFDWKIVFILCGIAAYIFDQMDGLWARMYGLSNAWGKFYDSFLDTVKYFLIDLAFILYYFDLLKAAAGDIKRLVIFVACFFAIKELYSASFIKRYKPAQSKKGIQIGWTGSTVRYFIAFPAIVFFPQLIIPYFAVSFAMYVWKVLSFVWTRYRASRYEPVGHIVEPSISN